MIENWEQFLLSADDGFPPLRCKSHTFYKLEAIGRYMEAFNQALKNQNWIIDRYYIDLQAGRGKVSIGGKIYLGSPLIALSMEPSFTQYRLNELDSENYDILSKRVAQTSKFSRAKLSQKDGNEVVGEFCDEINAREAQAKIRGGGSTVNLAFLDPYGLELKWSTVERLARIKRMDLIINFSTSALIRNARQALQSTQETAVDRFFGTNEWREVYNVHANATSHRRALIDFYLQRLKHFGYRIELNPDIGGSELSVKSARGKQIYSLIFASKHPLGNELWKGSSRASNQPRLPGM